MSISIVIKVGGILLCVLSILQNIGVLNSTVEHSAFLFLGGIISFIWADTIEIKELVKKKI